jgi:predicted secreted protein
MSWITAIAYYALFWWLTLFAVLSIGLRTQDDEGEVVPGTPSSAPAKGGLWKRLLLNTVISGVVFGCWYYATQVMGIGIDSMPRFFD